MNKYIIILSADYYKKIILLIMLSKILRQGFHIGRTVISHKRITVFEGNENFQQQNLLKVFAVTNIHTGFSIFIFLPALLYAGQSS